jgi:hypothetical protein
VLTLEVTPMAVVRIQALIGSKLEPRFDRARHLGSLDAQLVGAYASFANGDALTAR